MNNQASWWSKAILYLNTYGNAYNVIISTTAIVFSYVAWRNSLPEETKINVLIGDKISLLNYGRDGNKRITINIPLTFFNTGGKTEIIDKVEVELTNNKDNSKIILHAMGVSENFNESYGSEVSPDLHNPILLNPNSNQKLFYIFESDILFGSVSWVPRAGKYTIKLNAKYYLSKKIEKFTIFEHVFSKKDSILFWNNNNLTNTQSGTILYNKF